ncbi:MAG: hypothetical protein D6714_19010 [Bacteroidetes bacterium]|nr:MAG: hypothetical protein D6714_19010 [Bacteroidota bacterium]
MNRLRVPDGFYYQTVRDVTLRLSLSEPSPTPYFYQILGKDATGKTDVLMQGMMSADAPLHTAVPLPLHFDRLVVRIRDGAQTYEFEWPRQPVIQDQLTLSDDFTKA